MADKLSLIEANEHRLMRAWITGDGKAMRSLISSNFRLVLGSKPSVLLDSKSWLEGSKERFRCAAYRFGDIYSREIGSLVVFSTQLELQARLDGADWSGQMWVTDLWQKSRVRRQWKLAERHISRPDHDAELPTFLRSLQLWK